MSKKSMKPVSLAVGAAFVTSLAASHVAAEADMNTNPFAMKELSSGYMQLAYGGGYGEKSEKEGGYGDKKSDKEGKCGEGKCGGKKGEMKKDKEGSCGGKKSDKEGQCGGNK